VVFGSAEGSGDACAVLARLDVQGAAASGLDDEEKQSPLPSNLSGSVCSRLIPLIHAEILGVVAASASSAACAVFSGAFSCPADP